jgi:hypothetical protein
VLSVVVRSGPVVTAVNGTLVARLARMTWRTLTPSVHRDRRVRPVLGDYCLVGKPPQAARQLRTDHVVVSELRRVELPAGSTANLGFGCPPVTMVVRAVRLVRGPARPTVKRRPQLLPI